MLEREAQHIERAAWTRRDASNKELLNASTERIERLVDELARRDGRSPARLPVLTDVASGEGFTNGTQPDDHGD